MSLGRRAFLRVAALTPLAAKKAAEVTAAELSGTITAGHGNWHGQGGAPHAISGPDDRPLAQDAGECRGTR
ncbi:MAG: hypothetical protein IPK23_15020 [Rhizobiales bacterium]|nr:hypothetical protein [Hyphomicrobiales bacterium]